MWGESVPRAIRTAKSLDDCLAQTIERSGAEVVVDASPCRLDRLLHLSLPMVRVRYRFVQLGGEPVVDTVLTLLVARGQELASA